MPATRSEDEQKRLDRELIELLNELRVALPGVQVLFAFMLVVPFSQGFSSLTTVERWIYFAAFITAALAAALLIAPSSYHRIRFRQGDKEKMVKLGNHFLVWGLVFVAVSISSQRHPITSPVRADVKTRNCSACAGMVSSSASLRMSAGSLA